MKTVPRPSMIIGKNKRNTSLYHCHVSSTRTVQAPGSILACLFSLKRDDVWPKGALPSPLSLLVLSIAVRGS